MQNAARWGRLGLTLLLAAWGFAILRDPTDTIAHILILPIHETGHYLFMPFGELMYAAIFSAPVTSTPPPCRSGPWG